MLIDPPPTHTGTFGEIAFPLFVKSTPTLFPAPPGVFLRYLRLSRLLGLVRVSKGCHRKFRGHNFESCVTNFDKISFFSLRSR